MDASSLEQALNDPEGIALVQAILDRKQSTGGGEDHGST